MRHATRSPPGKPYPPTPGGAPGFSKTFDVGVPENTQVAHAFGNSMPITLRPAKQFGRTMRSLNAQCHQEPHYTGGLVPAPVLISVTTGRPLTFLTQSPGAQTSRSFATRPIYRLCPQACSQWWFKEVRGGSWWNMNFQGEFALLRFLRVLPSLPVDISPSYIGAARRCFCKLSLAQILVFRIDGSIFVFRPLVTVLKNWLIRVTYDGFGP